MLRKVSTRDRILIYIGTFSTEHGFSPSMREISTALGLKSVSTVHKHVSNLKQQGLLVNTEGAIPRSMVISKKIETDPADSAEERHICLKTDSGDSIILNCVQTGESFQFSGVYRIIGTFDRMGNIIACRELNEIDYDKMMVK